MKTPGAGRPAEVGAFLQAAAKTRVPPLDAVVLRALIFRLVEIDLEHRWRAWNPQTRDRRAWCLDDYARNLPELGGRDDWPDELIVAEYRYRHLWGDRPELTAFLGPFAGGRRERLLPQLRQAETAVATINPFGPRTAIGHDPLQTTDPSGPLAQLPDPVDSATAPDVGPVGRGRSAGELTQAEATEPGKKMADTAGPAHSSVPGTENLGAGSRLIPEMPPTANQGEADNVTSLGWGRSEDTRSQTASGKDRRDSPRSGAGLGMFGGFELLEELGRGGMGIVYKAREIELNRIVALKMILADESSSQTALQRFRIEAEIAGRLDHPCIVPVFQVGHHASRHFYAMGYIEGSTLAQRVSAGPLPQAEAVELVWQISEAIAYAHSRGVIHRDLKPGNVLIDAQGQPKVADFGLAKVVATESALTLTGEILGTPSFMAPEQAGGRTHEIGEAADIYALGAILYFLLTGRPPFQGPSTLETLSQVLHNDPVSPRRLQPKTDRDVETICLKCLAKPIGHRYLTAQLLLTTCADSLITNPSRHGRPAAATGSASSFAAIGPKPRR